MKTLLGILKGIKSGLLQHLEKLNQARDCREL